MMITMFKTGGEMAAHPFVQFDILGFLYGEIKYIASDIKWQLK